LAMMSPPVAYRVAIQSWRDCSSDTGAPAVDTPVSAPAQRGRAQPKPDKHKGQEEKQNLQPQRAQRNTEEIRKSKAKSGGKGRRKTPEATKKDGGQGEWKEMKIFREKRRFSRLVIQRTT